MIARCQVGSHSDDPCANTATTIGVDRNGDEFAACAHCAATYAGSADFVVGECSDCAGPVFETERVWAADGNTILHARCA